MIPILYESTETAFISNGLTRLRDCISLKVTEERNGIYEMDLEYPVDGLGFDLIKCGRIIGCTHDENGDIQPFDIVSYEEPIDGVVTFHGVHISYRLGGYVVSGTNINSLVSALNLLNNSQPENPFTFTTDKTSTAYMAAADGVPRTIRQMLGGVEGSILDAYGGEYEWDKFNVILHSARGEQKDFFIRYGVNLTDYNDSTDYQESFTAAVPYWIGDNGKGKEVVIKGSMISTGFTSYTGREICQPMDLSDKFETKPTAADLRNYALNQMRSNQAHLPQRSITVSFINLYDSVEYEEFANLVKCRLCDTINVVFPKYNMSGKFKIVKTVYDVLLDRYEEFELGNLSTSLSDALGISNSLNGANENEITVEQVEPVYTRSTGATGVTVEAWEYGRVTHIYVSVPRNVATSAGGNLATGTLSGISLPLDTVRYAAYNGSIVGILSIDNSGAVIVRVNAASSVPSTMSYFIFGGTYINQG